MTTDLLTREVQNVTTSKDKETVKECVNILNSGFNIAERYKMTMIFALVDLRNKANKALLTYLDVDKDEITQLINELEQK